MASKIFKAKKKIGSKNKDLQPTIIMKVMYIASSLRLC